jgi:phospholipid/cholesterol/gamma-HCH transport system substrate-binding protein
MPRTRSLAWAELKFGLIAVFSLVMAAILIFAVGGSGGFFWQNYPLKVVFMDVAGIKAGSPVRVAGVGVGTVNKTTFVPGGVEVLFDIKDEMKPLVTDQSQATIGSISLLGEGAVDISAAPQGKPLEPWSYVRTGELPVSIAQLTGTATDTLSSANKLLEDLRAGKGTIGKFFTDDSVYRELNNFVSAAEKVTRSINESKGSAGKFANDPKLYNELEASIANLNGITMRLKNGEGSLGQLLNDPALAKSLTATTSNFETLSGRLNKGEGTAGKLLNDDALYKRFDSMTQRLDSLVQQLNEGQGTAGALLHDKQLYENMNTAVTEIRALVTEIKKDPKKYLNVKVSIF